MFRVRNVIAAAAACGWLLIFGVSSAQATTIFFDNFNSDRQRLDATTLNQWDVTSGSIDVIGAGGFFDFYPGNGSYLDLDGSREAAGTITTKTAFNFVNGQQYQLEFDYGINTFNGGATEQINYLIALGGLFSGSIITPTVMPDLAHFIVTFFGDGSTAPLSIGAVGTDNNGPILDNVRISTFALPLPPSLALFAAGLGFFGLLGLWKLRVGALASPRYFAGTPPEPIAPLAPVPN